MTNRTPPAERFNFVPALASPGQSAEAITQPPVPTAATAIEVSEYLTDLLPPLSPEYVGRQDVLTQLDESLATSTGRVVCVHANEGEGKSSLLFHWLAQAANASPAYHGATKVSYWDLGSHAASRGGNSLSNFLQRALDFYGVISRDTSDDFARTARLVQAVQTSRSILILDGVEDLSLERGSINAGNPAVRALITSLSQSGFRDGGVLVLASSTPVEGLDRFRFGKNVSLPRLRPEEAAQIFESLGVLGTKSEHLSLAERHDNFPLTIALLAREMRKQNLRPVDILSRPSDDVTAPSTQRITDYCDVMFPVGTPERTALYVLSLFRRPASWEEVSTVLRELNKHPLPAPVPASRWNLVSTKVSDRGLIHRSGPAKLNYSVRPPVLVDHLARQFRQEHPEAFRECHAQLALLCARSAAPGDRPSLEELQPKYDAMFHLASAGNFIDALDVYWEEILRRRTFYTQKTLGAFSKDLQALSHFFEEGWMLRVDCQLPADQRAWLLSTVAYLLHALGRLPESEDLRHEELEWHTVAGHFLQASLNRAQLALTEILQCKLHEAVDSLHRALDHWKRSETQVTFTRFESNIDRWDVLDAIQSRMTLANYLSGKGDPAAHADLPATVARLNSSDGFYVFLVLLDGFERAGGPRGWDEVLASLRIGAESYQRRATESERPYVKAYSLIAQALVRWREQADPATIWALLEQARQQVELSGRLDVAPVIYATSLHIALTLEDRREADLVAIDERLENSLTLYNADLLVLEWWMLRVRLLRDRGDTSGAQAYGAEMQLDERLRRYWGDEAIRALTCRTDELGER